VKSTRKFPRKAILAKITPFDLLYHLVVLLVAKNIYRFS